MHLKWWLLDEDQKRHVWALYGRFTLLSFISCCAGATAWGARMQELLFIVPAQISESSVNRQLPPSELMSMYMQGFRWAAVYLVAYAIDFFCSSIAKLLVLSRMRDFAVPSAVTAQRRWTVCGRIVTALVILGNTAGLISNIAAAAYREQLANIYSDASAAFAANNTALGINLLVNSLDTKFSEGTNAASYQELLEAIVLLIIVAAFIAVGGMGARLLNSALRHLKNAQDSNIMAGTAGAQVKNLAVAASAEGRQLRRKILATCLVAFVTFLLRAVFSIIYASANKLQNTNCSYIHGTACSPCWNEYAYMQFFILFTPEFQLTIVLLSTPLSLLVALWGMTDVRALELMSSNRQQLAILRVQQ